MTNTRTVEVTVTMSATFTMTVPRNASDEEIKRLAGDQAWNHMDDYIDVEIHDSGIE